MRLNYSAVAPEAIKALAAVNVALLNAGLDRHFRDLLFLRVSQINGCALPSPMKEAIEQFCTQLGTAIVP